MRNWLQRGRRRRNSSENSINLSYHSSIYNTIVLNKTPKTKTKGKTKWRHIREEYQSIKASNLLIYQSIKNHQKNTSNSWKLTTRNNVFNGKLKLYYMRRTSTRIYLRLVVLISSLVSLAENKPRLFTMSSHFWRASHPFLKSSWTKHKHRKTQQNHEAITQQQQQKRDVCIGLAYLINPGLCRGGVDLAGLLKKRRQRHVLYFALTHRWNRLQQKEHAVVWISVSFDYFCGEKWKLLLQIWSTQMKFKDGKTSREIENG